MEELWIIPAPAGLTAQIREPAFDDDDDAPTYTAHVLAIAWRAADAPEWEHDGPGIAGTSYLVSIPVLGGAPIWRHGTALHNVLPEPPR